MTDDNSPQVTTGDVNTGVEQGPDVDIPPEPDVPIPPDDSGTPVVDDTTTGGD